MSKLLKKLILSSLASLVVLFSLAPFWQAKADEAAWYNQSPTGWFLKVYDPDASPQNEIFGERYTAAQVQWVFYSVGSFLTNLVLLGHSEVAVCLLKNPGVSAAACAPVVLAAVADIVLNLPGGQGMVKSDRGFAINILNTVGSNPISGIAYTKNLVQRLNPISEVKAQGFGYSTAGNAMIDIWRAARNISFGLLVVAVIILAFMIMFRVKISPQVIITIQSALPKIILSLILITFSYAIAGFVIDLMYVVLGLLAALISSAGLTGESASKLFLEFTSSQSAIGLMYKYIWAFGTGTLLSITSSLNPGVWIGGVLFSLLSIFINLILFWYMIKLLYLTFKNFAMILLTIIIGPFEILLGTVTQAAGFGTWLRRLISYLAYYPILALLFYLAFFFLAQSYARSFLGAGTLLSFFGQHYTSIFPFNPKFDAIGPNSWHPPLTVGAGTDTEGLLWLAVSLIIVMMTPKVTELIQSFISGKPFAYGTGIGEAGGLAYKAGRGGLSAGITKWEEGRALEAAGIEGATYSPAAITQLLKTLGIIAK